MRRILLGLVAGAWLASVASAQTVVGERLQLSTGPCTLRSGSGAPAAGLGAVCDTYFRTDSPYTVLVKTGASTWSEIYRAGGTDVAVADGGTGLSSFTTGDLVYASGATTLAGRAAVATGQVLTSAGTSTAPVWSASPSVTAVTASGAVSGATVAGTTSMTTPSLLAAADLTLTPTGDLILAPTGLDVLPNSGYTKNLGALTNKFLALHVAELWAETLVAQNTIATIGGRILVGPTTTLTSDLASGATSMSVKHNQMVSGARVVLQVNNAIEWIAVTSAASGSGPYTYSISRDLDGSGANNWTAGDAVFNTGTTANGFIDLYSVAGVIAGSTAGPTIVGNVRTGTTYSDIAPRWAIGNLNGIAGYATDVYGAFFGDAAATNVTVDATNGFRIRNSTTNKFVADTSGNLSIVGDLTVGTSGIIRSGATDYATGTGYVLDYNAGTPRVRVGTTAGNRIAWDGTDLTVVSANVALDSTGVSLAMNTSPPPPPAAPPPLATTNAVRFTAGDGGTSALGGGYDSSGKYLYLQVENDDSGDYGRMKLIAKGETDGGTERTSYIELSAGYLNGSDLLGEYVDVSADFVTFSTSVESMVNMKVNGAITLNTDVSSQNAGSIAQTAVNGLTLRGVSGSTYDFFLGNRSGTGVIANVANTTEIQIAGVSSDGNGKVLCVKSDGAIGTCNASSIGDSTCTCG
jgi:hypothetical protein